MDIATIRAETPGCANVLHLNNAGASLPPAAVLERVEEHLRLEAEIGGYEAADRVAEEYDRIYASIARLLGAEPAEIALMESATLAWSAAFSTLAERFQPGDRILTAANEYASNYVAFLQMARRRGVEIVVVPSEENGQISLRALEAAIDRHGPRVKLVALTHVPSNGGLVQPAAEVGRIARGNGIPFLLDACQSVGQAPLSVEELGCDLLSATGRKYLRGPRGTGFLYVRQSFLERMDRENLEPPLLNMRSADWIERNRYRMRPDAKRFEVWECSVACRLGLGVAVEYALALGLEMIASRVTMLAERLRSELAGLPGVTVRDLPGDGRQPRCGIVTFTHDRHSAQEIFERMRSRSINVRVTPVFVTRIDMEDRGLPEMVRASVHYYNTEEELTRFREAMRAF